MPTAPPSRPLPALYMVWDGARVRRASSLAGYAVRPVPSETVPALRPVVELDGALTDAQWTELTDRALPDGVFAAYRTGDPTPIGTASALHNPRGTRHHFPGGGALGYMVVHPAHRGRGVGRALADAVVTRFRSAGYRTVWLGVQDHRLPAIRTYLSAGFVPFLHAPDPERLAARWRGVYAAIGIAPDESRWRRALPHPAETVLDGDAPADP